MKPNLEKLKKLVIPHLDPNLLEPKYREWWSPENPTLGFCSLVTEVTYFLVGGSNSGYISYVARDKDDTTHWWLDHKTLGKLDLSKEQYTNIGLVPPYERGNLGKPCGFQGMRVDENNPWGFQRKPSIRAQKIIDSILKANKVTNDRIPAFQKSLFTPNPKNKTKFKI
jgi:hypothetical protein